MKHSLFISDLHLDESQPEITHTFLIFLKKTACFAENLYILGDLFESWVGDDCQTPWLNEIKFALHKLSKTTQIFFIHGNRDFLLGNHFANEVNMTLLPDPYITQLYGQKMILTHGDQLCTQDLSYQRFRHFTQKKWVRKGFLALPLSLRQYIASTARKKSKHHQKNIQDNIMDITPSAAEELLMTTQTNYLIHGHTHRPNIHQHGTAQRIVLGAWDQSAQILTFNADGSYHLGTIPNAVEEPAC